MGTRININGYKKAFLRCALLFIVGAVLQLFLGNTDASLLRYPWGPIIAVNYLYILILAYSKSDQWKWIRSIFDHYAMTASLASMTLGCVIFGLSSKNIASSWPFLFIMLDFITILGLRSIDDICHWRSRRHIPIITHCAVFLVFAAGFFSSPDKQRLRVIAPVGHPVNVAVDESGKQRTLPFTITLRQFSIEEYPPKLYMIDPVAGTSSKDFISLEKGVTSGLIGDWKINVVEYIDSAGKVPYTDKYVAMNHVGATSAVLVEAFGPEGKQSSGWISCGSHIFPASTLTLDNTHALVMPPREPALYMSDVKIENSKGIKEHKIRVNQPASVGPWKIYQLSYDKERGRWSTISVLECVKDGWYPIVQVALWIILAAGAAMAFNAGLRNKRKEGSS